MLETARANDRAAYKKTIEKTRKYKREYHKERYSTDLDWKLRHILRTRLQSAVMFRINGKVKRKRKAGSFVRDLGCSTQSLIEYVSAKFQPPMTWENWGALWQLDHIRPLASFDLTDREQFLEASHFTNLQPLLIGTHKIKSARERSSIIQFREAAA